MLTLKEIAQEIEKALDIKTTEIYEEDDVSDAGIEFTGEYSLQYAPYLEKPYIFHFFDGEAQNELLAARIAEELITGITSLPKAIFALEPTSGSLDESEKLFGPKIK